MTDEDTTNNVEKKDDAKTWKTFYERPSNEDTPTRIAYLSEYFQFNQTPFGGLLSEDEAISYTRQVHKMMEALDSDSDTIDCLLDDERVWEWVHARIETEFSGRTLQKYLLSLENFCKFVSWGRDLPPHIPRFKKETKSLAQSMAQSCKGFRSSVGKIAVEKRWKRLLVDPVFVQRWAEEAVRKHQLIQRVLRLDDSESVEASSSEPPRQEPTCKWPRRKKWTQSDTKIVKKHFKNNPGRKTIRKKIEEVEELQELVEREGLERCLEKVKSLFKSN